jgi:2-polyprenyl-6-methoxyphenol hydroxylase-like FAD-dependent oxidoreductase
MMLGLLLARAGVKTLVLEKHADFLRDFRGDTIHPSTLGLMHELGLLAEFLKLPHQKAYHLAAQFGAHKLRVADFSHLSVHCPFVAFMPQWDFLNFLAGHAQRYPNFELRMQAAVESVIEQDGIITGVRAETATGTLEVRAQLVVAADGRGSDTRASSGLGVTTLGAPMDVQWFSLPLHEGDPEEAMGHFAAGQILILIKRTEHWQCGFVIPKGSDSDLRTAGLPAWRESIATLAPFLADRIGEITAWDEVKLLSVAVDRLPVWHRPGLLLIGDAAHAMSPIGGVGINLAIQDAVASANILARKLAQGTLDESDLSAVQKRREWPTRVTQRLQLIIQERLIRSILTGGAALRPPLPLRVMARLPWLQRLPARLIGIGVRPEHIESRTVEPSA